MKRKMINVAIAALLLLAGAMFWLRPFSTAGQEPPGLNDSQIASEQSSLLPSSNSSVEVEQMQAATVQAQPTEDRNDAQLYGDTKLPLGERFRLLLERVDQGNEAAAHLALGIANGCNAINGMAPGTPPLGAEKATVYQRLVDKRLRDECREVLLSPAFQKTIDALRKRTANMYSEPVKQAIRRAYADGGASSGLIAGIEALKSRPDDVTARVVAGQFSELEISSVYLAPLMRSAEAQTPKYRDGLVSRAIQFLACDFGRPCGPSSFDVGMICLTFGACIPGADLQTVITQELMTGQDARDVQAILDRLRQVAR